MRTESGILPVHCNNHCKAKHLRDIRTYDTIYSFNDHIHISFTSTTETTEETTGSCWTAMNCQVNREVHDYIACVTLYICVY